MNIAEQLQIHAQQELKHALTIFRQIDYLGHMPSVTPKPVKASNKAREMLQFDLDNENETIPRPRLDSEGYDIDKPAPPYGGVVR